MQGVCPFCRKMKTSEINISKHILRYSVANPIKCDNKTFRKMKFAEKSAVTKRLIHTGEKTYMCDICCERFTGKGDLRKHLIIHTDQKKWAEKDALGRHCRVSLEKLQPCQSCKKIFARQSAHTNRLLMRTVKKSFSCHICNKAFAGKDTLRRHLLVHKGKTPQTCNFCEKKFSHKRALAKHLRLIHNVDPYSNYTCDKTIAGEIDLRNIHKDEQLHTCEVCAKTFAEKDTLNRHRRAHVGEIPPHTYEVWRNKFAQKSILSRHIFSHTVEKPNSSEVSKKTFAEKDTHSRHHRVHIEETLHTCRVCRKKFSTADLLRKHLLIHSEEKPPKVCEKTFAETGRYP